MNPTTPKKSSTKKVVPGAPIKGKAPKTMVGFPKVGKAPTGPFSYMKPVAKPSLKPKSNLGKHYQKAIIPKVGEIIEISDGAFQRLAHKAGCKYVSALTYGELRGVLISYLSAVIRKATTFTEHDRRRRVVENDFREALRLMGRSAMFEDGKQVKTKGHIVNLPFDGDAVAGSRTIKKHSQPPTKMCNFYQGGSRGSKNHPKIHIGGDLAESDHDNDEPEYQPSDDDNDDDEYELEGEDDEQDGGATDGTKKPHRYKPGTVSLRRIRYYQKQAGHCFNINKATFRRLVRSIANDWQHALSFSLDAMMVCQLDAEQYIVHLCQKGLLCAIHSGRARVMPKDIQLARRIGCQY